MEPDVSTRLQKSFKMQNSLTELGWVQNFPKKIASYDHHPIRSHLYYFVIWPYFFSSTVSIFWSHNCVFNTNLLQEEAKPTFFCKVFSRIVKIITRFLSSTRISSLFVTTKAEPMTWKIKIGRFQDIVHHDKILHTFGEISYIYFQLSKLTEQF